MERARTARTTISMRARPTGSEHSYRSALPARRPARDNGGGFASLRSGPRLFVGEVPRAMAHNADGLDGLLPVVARWFRATFGAPTPPQRQGWPAIAAGQSTLIFAPTGSGKTLAAFLACLDHLWRVPRT